MDIVEVNYDIVDKPGPRCHGVTKAPGNLHWFLVAEIFRAWSMTYCCACREWMGMENGIFIDSYYGKKGA